jgi:N-acetylglutamate synthase-like GNAT family acetyltransferase
MQLKMSNPNFKQATIADLPLIQKLAESIWRAHYAAIITLEQINYMLDKYCSVEAMTHQIRHEHYQYFLICQQDHPIGYFAVKPEPENKKLFISKVYLEAASQGKGIGQAVLKYIENLAKKQSIQSLYLTVNKQNHHAVKAYQKHGLCIIDSVVTDIGSGYVMDDFIMEKKLTDLS